MTSPAHPDAPDLDLDLLIADATVHRLGRRADVAVRGGRIVEIGAVDARRAAVVVEAAGRLLAPSFVDSHTHLDKVLLWDDERYRADVRAFEEAWYASASRDDYGPSTAWPAEDAHMARLLASGATRDEIVAELTARMSTVIEWAIAHGTGTIKSHTTWGEVSVEAITLLKRRYAGRIDLLAIVPWPAADAPDGPTSLTREGFARLAAEGLVDFIGGYYSHGADRAEIDALFEFAAASGLPVDLHVDEQDDPDFSEYDYILDRALAAGVGQRLSCSHLTALDSVGVDPDALATVVAKARAAQSNVISLPSCNMYLMGRKQGAPRRRGATRLDLFLAAGVNTAIGSDNIRDGWRPYGNADLLEEALLGAHVLQYAHPDQLVTVFDMITRNPARNAGLTRHGVEVGCDADLVLLDAGTPAEAILTRAARTVVVKGGAVVARDGRLV
ncbi:amidohydrolase family protein [Herbiconiux moechotypicola]|uniref:Amidohydrolase family protein n=1 Tax=Herbiconiux moechotypicola TaxID=637393 RepID=A0ABN3D750_9MICO|nr:amidohydrolase family protein [Herbiconiux moechotypicola]MCS5728483.1 amidohydrolase family protein [Herbiconiux moechotypicola]